MIDTNQVQQAAQVVAEAKSQFAPYVPALAVAAAWAGRELKNFNAWCAGVAQYVIAHGGIGWLIWKLLWNPPASNQSIKNTGGGGNATAAAAEPTAVPAQSPALVTSCATKTEAVAKTDHQS